MEILPSPHPIPIRTVLGDEVIWSVVWKAFWRGPKWTARNRNPAPLLQPQAGMIYSEPQQSIDNIATLDGTGDSRSL